MSEDSWASSLIDALEEGPRNPLWGLACDWLLPRIDHPVPPPPPPVEHPVYKVIREAIARNKKVTEESADEQHNVGASD